MSVLENIPKKKQVNKLKKTQKELIEKQKKEKFTESKNIEESNGLSSVVSTSDNLLNKKYKKKKKNKKVINIKSNAENSESALNKNLSKKKKEEKIKISKDENKESNEDTSVFTVTEKLLKKKLEQKQKKIQKGIAKKKAEIKENTANQALNMKEFFKELDKGVKGKAKPKWFDVKLKRTVANYLTIVEICDQDPTPENKLIKSVHEKRLYKFFLKLSKHLGEEIDVIKHWFHTTKKGVLKLGLRKKEDSKPLTVKFNLNKKLNAIVKETAAAAPGNTGVKSDKPPAWFDENFAELVKSRNKARRQYKLSPTEENKKAYQLALKKVKTEQKMRKKTGFVSSEPHSNDNEKPKGGKSFTKNSKSAKRFDPSNGKSRGKFGSYKPNEKPRGFTPPSSKSPRNNTPSNVKSPKNFTPSNVKASPGFGSFNPNTPNKHIKFEN